MRPFTRRLVVFNPNRDEEVEWLKSLPENKRLKDVYIASELDGPRGWEQLQDVQDFIDDNVFLLKSDVWQRFDIERTPSIVTSEGLMFKIEEFAVESKVNESTPTPKAEDEL
jgi:conjugal transfer pilus assembly protein TraW